MEEIQKIEVENKENRVVEKVAEKKEDERKGKDIEIIKPRIDIFDALKIISPGTSLRIAIDDIQRARTGALIVVVNEIVIPLLDGGFRVNCKFTPQKLAELCKMDGAVILSEDLKRILYANVLLIPDSSIMTSETGTRHKAAERTAKQADTLVIAVSERRNKVTVYYADARYVLRNAEEILRRATENLQILEKQREIYNELMINLNIMEVTGLVSVSDVCSLLQRIEMINRVNENIRKSIVELGKEGSIVKMRLRELTKNIDRTEQVILRDYTVKPHRIKQLLSEISFDDLIDIEGMSKLLFNRNNNDTIQPKGYRFLSKINLDEQNIKALINSFKNLNNLLSLSTEDLVKVVKDEEVARGLQKEIASLKENIMVGNKI